MQRQAAELQAVADADLASGDIDKLQAAAAEIAGHAVRLPETGDDAERGDARFLGAGQNRDGDTARRLRRLDEIRPVRRLARRRGGDDVELLHPHLRGKRHEPPQRADRLRNGVGSEIPALGDAGAEAGQHLLVEKRRGRTGQPLIDDETDRVRSDVDDRNGTAAWNPALRGPAISRAGGAKKHEGKRISAIGRGPRGLDSS